MFAAIRSASSWFTISLCWWIAAVAEVALDNRDGPSVEQQCSRGELPTKDDQDSRRDDDRADNDSCCVVHAASPCQFALCSQTGLSANEVAPLVALEVSQGSQQSGELHLC